MEFASNTKKLRLILKLALGVLVFASNLSGRADALPGKSIKSELEWAKNNSILPKLTYYSEAYTYSGSTKFEDGELFLGIGFTNPHGMVTREDIFYTQNDPDLRLAFTRNDPNGLRLIEQIYDRSIVDDFCNSKYVFQNGDSEFYQGQKFAYIVDNNIVTEDKRYGKSLEVIRLEDLQNKINDVKFCQTHDCSNRDI